MQKFVISGRPQKALAALGLGLSPRHLDQYWYSPYLAHEKWISTMDQLDSSPQAGDDSRVNQMALTFQMARISILRHRQNTAELELFSLTTLLLIEILERVRNCEAAFAVLLEALCVFNDIDERESVNMSAIDRLEAHLIFESKVIHRKYCERPFLRLVYSAEWAIDLLDVNRQ